MDTQRKEAYRHLLYTALLHLRSGHRDVVWWSFPSWFRTASELRKNKALADCFHNLALFSIHDFERFDENMFWEDIKRLRIAQGSEIEVRYRRIFDEYVAGRSACTL